MTETTDSAETRELKTATRRWRPWRWLIAGIAIVLLIAIAIPATLAYRTQQTLARMREAGGKVQIYAPAPRSRGWLDRAWRDLKQELPEALRCLDPEQELTVLFDRTAAIDDQWLIESDFSSLPCRILIGIYHPDVSDAGICVLANIQQLEGLYVARTQLTDDGLKAFAGHEKLSPMGLHGTQVTAAGLSVLSTLPELRHADVSGTEITGSELRQLRSCSRLEALNVDPEQLTESFLLELRQFPMLSNINILAPRMSLPGWPEPQQSSACNDAVLQRVLKVTQIEYLIIHDGRWITDASVPGLLSAKHLRRLMISDAGMSHAAAVRVNAGHPQAVGPPAVQLASESSGH